LCAGVTSGIQGSCKGDSGGPLMHQDLERDNLWVQIATVKGGFRDCGDPAYPGLYIRLDDPSVFHFIRNVTNSSKEDNPESEILSTKSAGAYS